MDAPARIYNVLQSFFSVGRHYGGCRAFGHLYLYQSSTDSLVREDMLRQERLRTTAEAAARSAAEAAKQLGLFPVQDATSQLGLFPCEEGDPREALPDFPGMVETV